MLTRPPQSYTHTHFIQNSIHPCLSLAHDCKAVAVVASDVDNVSALEYMVADLPNACLVVLRVVLHELVLHIDLIVVRHHRAAAVAGAHSLDLANVLGQLQFLHLLGQLNSAPEHLIRL